MANQSTTHTNSTTGGVGHLHNGPGAGISETAIMITWPNMSEDSSTYAVPQRIGKL